MTCGTGKQVSGQICQLALQRAICHDLLWAGVTPRLVTAFLDSCRAAHPDANGVWASLSFPCGDGAARSMISRVPTTVDHAARSEAARSRSRTVVLTDPTDGDGLGVRQSA